MHLSSLKSINQQTKHPSAKHRERWWRLPRFLERGSGMKAFADFRMAAQRHTSTSLVGSLCGTKTREPAGSPPWNCHQLQERWFMHLHWIYKNKLVWLYILCGGFCNFLNQVLCVFSLLKNTYVRYTIGHWQHVQRSACWNLGKKHEFSAIAFFHIQSCQSNLAKLCPRSWHTHGHFSAMRKKKSPSKISWFTWPVSASFQRNVSGHHFFTPPHPKPQTWRSIDHECKFKERQHPHPTPNPQTAKNRQNAKPW